MNDIFILIIYVSTFYHLLELFTASKYNSSRIQRINHLFNKGNLSIFLPFKTYIANNLFKFMLLSLLLSIAFFSLLLGITERTYSRAINSSL